MANEPPTERPVDRRPLIPLLPPSGEQQHPSRLLAVDKSARPADVINSTDFFRLPDKRAGHVWNLISAPLVRNNLKEKTYCFSLVENNISTGTHLTNNNKTLAAS
jgi:hypothetical protein